MIINSLTVIIMLINFKACNKKFELRLFGVQKNKKLYLQIKIT